MGDLLYQYERLEPITWAYLSGLLVIALFFKFNRVFSVRNIDLALLLLLSPGLLCVRYGMADGSKVVELFGYWWLFGVNGLLLFRALWDTRMVRRPMLEPNMNAAGMGFLAISLFMFLMANVITGGSDASDLFSAQRAQHFNERKASNVEASSLDTHGPGFTLLFWLPSITTSQILGDEASALAEGPLEENGAAAVPAEVANVPTAAESADTPQQTEAFTTGAGGYGQSGGGA